MNRKKTNGNKKFYKPKNQVDQDCSQNLDKETNHGYNDDEWYYVSEQMLHDVAAVPYSIPVGMPFKRDGYVTPMSIVTPHAYDDAVPGLFVSHLMPVLGVAKDASSPVNVAANSVYQYVRSQISGSRPYDCVDMMIYLGAMDSLYCQIVWMTRLYSTVFTYHEANRYLSRALIEAQHVDYDDLVANLSTFRQRLNVLIAKVRALYLPSNMAIFQRHTWLFRNYYIEGDYEKDQIYFHVPAGYHYFTLDSDNAGMLKAVRYPISGALLTTNQLINALEAMISPIYADEDFNRISGDFLKAYQGKVFTLTEIPDISTIQLFNDERVLLQIKNAKYKQVLAGATDDVWAGNFFDYKQDSTKRWLHFEDSNNLPLFNITSIDANTNTLYPVANTSTSAVKGCMNVALMNWSKDTLLTSPRGSVTEKETMKNTRLTLGLHMTASSSYDWLAAIDDVEFGTEWPVKFQIYTFHKSKTSPYTLTLFHRDYERVVCLEYASTTRVQQTLDSQWPVLSAFKYIPELALVLFDTVGGNTNVYDPGRSIFEIDNYALIGHSVIVGLHAGATLGEFNIPKLSIGQ